MTRLPLRGAKIIARSCAALLLGVFAHGALASSNGVVVSQVYGGGGNSAANFTNDFIEIFNGGNSAVSTNGWSVQYAATAGSSWQVTPLANVTLQPGQYLLIQEQSGGGTSGASLTPDVTGSINLSASAGKVALVQSTSALTGAQPTSSSIIDVVGYGANTNFSEGSPAPGPSGNTQSIARAAQGCTDTNSNAADFSTGVANPRNSSTPRHPCNGSFDAPITTTCPAVQVVAGNGGSGSAAATDVDSIVNGVSLSNAPNGITLGAISPASANGGNASVPILVSAAVPAGSYQITLTWTNNTLQSAMCTPTVTAGTLTKIYSIQGSGTTSPIVGQSVITQGVVTFVSNAGFYMQDPNGDGDPTTSDGIYVYTGSTPTVAVNDLAQVSGTVVEFNPGLASNADTSSHTITELSSVSSVTRIGTGSITPVVIDFPFANRDQMEQYEGMLVTINGPLTVAQTFYLGQYGQLTIAAQGAVETPTNRYRPGSSAQALYTDNKRRSLVLDDGLTSQDPNPTPFLGQGNTVRQGDTVASVTGVIDYGLQATSSDPGSWKIIPTVAPQFTRANARTTAPDDVGGTIRIGSANVDNFFTTFSNGQTADGQTGQGCTVGSSTSAGNCRGADNITEFNRQRDKVVAELSALGADVIGIMELQNNGPVAIGNLVNAINAKLGSTVYAAISDPSQGTGTDAIKVGMIYKPATLTPSGASISDPNTIYNRQPLAQTFTTASGETFTLVVNHLKAKACSASATGLDADQGDLQSCFNDARRKQVAATLSFVSSLFPSGSTPNVLLVGDFNAYAQEDPINDVTSAGYTDELGKYNTFGYSFQFDASSGRLDHALSSPAMSSKIKRALEWHVNADEPSILDYNLEFKQPACGTCSPDYYTPTPYRASDHDPLVVGVAFDAAPPPPPKKKK